VLSIGGATPDKSGEYVKVQGSDKNLYVVALATIDTSILGLIDTPPRPTPSPSPSPIGPVPIPTAAATPSP
jgi:hypothetical protein